MQISMLCYSNLDIFDEKEKLLTEKQAEGLRQQNQANAPKGQPAESVSEKTYLGLLSENFVSVYELDVYGLISLTNYKYIMFKHETRTNPMGSKPADRYIKALFQSLQKMHTNMVLNPFFSLPSE